MASTMTETVFMPIGVAANWTEPITSGEMFVQSQPVYG